MAQTPAISEVSTNRLTRVPPGNSTSFTVQFKPTAPGTRTATISFTEADPTTLSFAISGTAVATPAVTVFDPSGIFSGNPFAATALAERLRRPGGQWKLRLHVLRRTRRQWNRLFAPPTSAGTYTVVAAFTSTDPNYVNSRLHR